MRPLLPLNDRLILGTCVPLSCFYSGQHLASLLDQTLARRQQHRPPEQWSSPTAKEVGLTPLPASADGSQVGGKRADVERAPST